MRVSRLLPLILLAALPAHAQGPLPRARIIDSVVTLQDPAQSYVLYLPSGYDTKRRWPVLYCFDPGGRGTAPVALFRAAAERHGWILAASNNSRNGPWKDIYLAAWALWDDTRARLRIDITRVYAAGFSGGARVACGLARILDIQVAGVIACGGGLPEWLEPADMAATPWFGTVGRQDFNFHEMKNLKNDLGRQGSPCRLSVFAGKHSWPPAHLAMEAVVWLEDRFQGREKEENHSGSDSDSGSSWQ